MLTRLFKGRSSSPAPSPDKAPPSLPAGQRVYAIGDIHGRADLLQKLLALIAADSAAKPGAEVTLIYLGDYVDRGPTSREVIELVMAAPSFADRVVRLRGNHEDALEAFLLDSGRGRLWLDYGGMATLHSYGVRIPTGMPAEERLPYMSRELNRLLPDSHRNFYRELSLYEVVGDYYFVHAGVNPTLTLAEQDPFDLMTIRSPFLEWGRRLEKMIVHGHSIAPEPEFRAWRIGIDTGAYATGHLTALVLEGETQRVLAT